MIAVERMGTSYLGEVWYAEADTPQGPWVYARKIVTHDGYSFYNPKQHPIFDQDKGRGNLLSKGRIPRRFRESRTRRPDMNTTRSCISLTCPIGRLAHAGARSIAIRRDRAWGLACYRIRADPDRSTGQIPQIAFFAPDRQGIASIPVYQNQQPGQDRMLRIGPGDQRQLSTQSPVFFILPADIERLYRGDTTSL